MSLPPPIANPDSIGNSFFHSSVVQSAGGFLARLASQALVTVVTASVSAAASTVVSMWATKKAAAKGGEDLLKTVKGVVAEDLEKLQRGVEWNFYASIHNIKKASGGAFKDAIALIKSEIAAAKPMDDFVAAMANMGAAFGKFGTHLGEGLEQLMKQFKDDPHKFMNEQGKFFVTNILPKYAFWTTVVTGVPLVVNYVYINYVNSIGRPKLAIKEFKATGFKHAVTSRVSAVVNKILKRTASVSASPIFNPEISRRINEFVGAIRCTIKNKGFFQNILVFGPGGVGKTMIAEKIARDANVNFVMMSGGDLAQYIKRGEHVTELNTFFDAAEKSPLPTILFIDEAEGLCLDRNIPQSPERIELLNTFLNRTGTESKKIILILATNHWEKFDEAVVSRMDHIVEIGLPEKEERMKIINMYLPQFFDAATLNTTFTPTIVEKIAEATAGFSGRKIFKMLNVMLGKKTSSPENKLSPTMIIQTVGDFIAQEAAVHTVHHGASAISKAHVAPGAPENTNGKSVEGSSDKTMLQTLNELWLKKPTDSRSTPAVKNPKVSDLLEKDVVKTTAAPAA